MVPRSGHERRSSDLALPSSPGTSVTTLDVLENFFGDDIARIDPKRLDATQINELAEHVQASARAQLLTGPLPEGVCYPGGWFAANWYQEFWRAELKLALLYYPRLLVNDPIAE